MLMSLLVDAMINADCRLLLHALIFMKAACMHLCTMLKILLLCWHASCLNMSILCQNYATMIGLGLLIGLKLNLLGEILQAIS